MFIGKVIDGSHKGRTIRSVAERKRLAKYDPNPISPEDPVPELIETELYIFDRKTETWSLA